MASDLRTRLCWFKLHSAQTAKDWAAMDEVRYSDKQEMCLFTVVTFYLECVSDSYVVPVFVLLMNIQV